MCEILPIAQLGADVLRRVAPEVRDIDTPQVQELIDRLFATCNEARGMGIAAPQVYADARMFIISSKPNERYPNAPFMQPTAIINPEIIAYGGTMHKDWEGCLSIPGIRALVPRHTRLHVRYATREGEHVETVLEGFLARVFAHEFDHLEGTVFIDRVESTRDIVTEREFRRIIGV